jgi:hypothetical protein
MICDASLLSSPKDVRRRLNATASVQSVAVSMNTLVADDTLPAQTPARNSTRGSGCSSR